MVQNSVCACVQDCVCTHFKDSYSLGLVQTTVARKTKEKVFVLKQRELASCGADCSFPHLCQPPLFRSLITEEP